jgi:hypothetical protein
MALLPVRRRVRNGNYRHGRRSRAYIEKQRQEYLAANPWIGALRTIRELLAYADELKREGLLCATSSRALRGVLVASLQAPCRSLRFLNTRRTCSRMRARRSAFS